METQAKTNTDTAATGATVTAAKNGTNGNSSNIGSKIAIVTVVTLLLLVPFAIIKGIINSRSIGCLAVNETTSYAIAVVAMVFTAGLFIEYLTKRSIHVIQYIVTGLSLMLFYLLLLSFSEFIPYGTSYLIAATMTTSALVLYFRAILKHSSAYILRGFVALIYATNYILLQMETYSLLTGSLLFFIMLCVVMYFTSGINDKRPGN